MLVNVSKSASAGGTCAKEGCNLPFKKGSVMIGIKSGYDQVHYRHMDCITPAEILALGNPRETVIFNNLKPDVQHKLQEWYDRAVYSSNDCQSDGSELDGSSGDETASIVDVVASPSRKLAKSSVDKLIDNDKVVRNVQSSNSIMGTIKNLVGYGAGYGDNDMNANNEEVGSDVEVVDSLSEQSADEEFDQSSAASIDSEDIPAQEIVNTESENSDEEVAEESPRKNVKSRPKVTSKTTKLSRKPKKSVIVAENSESEDDKPVSKKSAKGKKPVKVESDQDEFDHELSKKNQKSLPPTPMVRSSRTKKPAVVETPKKAPAKSNTAINPATKKTKGKAPVQVLEEYSDQDKEAKPKRAASKNY